MDRQDVPARVGHKTSLKDYDYCPVQQRLVDMQVIGIPWDRIESTMVNTQIDSTHPQSATITPVSLPTSTSSYQSNQDFILKYANQSPAKGPTNKRKMSECENEVEDEDDDYEGVLVIDEDREDEEESLPHETGFASPNQPQLVITQDLANVASQLLLIDSTHPQSSSVTALPLPSNFTHHNHQELISNYDSQQVSPVNSQPNSKRENEDDGDDDSDSVQWLDNDEESSQSVKKPKLDTTRTDNAQCSKVVRQSVSDPTIKRKIWESEDEVYHEDTVQWHDDGHVDLSTINYHGDKVKPMLVCRAMHGCTYQTTNSGHRHAHEGVHLGIWPYRCSWPDCHYSSEHRHSALVHIKRYHFRSSSVMAQAGATPVDYLLVDHWQVMKHRWISRTFLQ